MQPSYESYWALIARFSNEWLCDYCDLSLGFEVKRFLLAIACYPFKSLKLVQSIWQLLQSFSSALTQCHMCANKTYFSSCFSLMHLWQWIQLCFINQVPIRTRLSWLMFTDVQDASLIFFQHSLIPFCSCEHHRISIFIFKVTASAL